MELKVMQLREGSKKNSYFLDAGKRKQQQSVQYSMCSWHGQVGQQLRKHLSRVQGARVRKREMHEYLEKIERKNVILKFLPCKVANP